MEKSEKISPIRYIGPRKAFPADFSEKGGAFFFGKD